MARDRVTANLPSGGFDGTEAFYARLGFARWWRDEDWMILRAGPLEIEFFPSPGHDPRTTASSACVRVNDLDALHAAWSRAGLSQDARRVPRLMPPERRPGVPRMFALVDGDGNLLRCLENEGAA